MKLKGWKELDPGSIILDAGNAATYNTGSWRSMRPRWIEENCIQCMFCWVYCPDASITTTKEGLRGEFDYDHCKGCGVCAMECPGKKGQKAIVMEEEGK